MNQDHRINLRLPMRLFDELDALRTRASLGISRNGWIEAAIREKIERDRNVIIEMATEEKSVRRRRK
jgi:hypothetical protein